MQPSQVFYIEPNQNFLEELAQGIINRFQNITEISILLPSRRSCIELEKILIRINNTTCILPQIIPIADLGKETMLLEDNNFYFTQKHLSEFEQKLHLAELIYTKTNKKITYPQALDIASSLADVVAQFIKNDSHLLEIKKLNFIDTAEHTEQLLEYLNILTEEWPLFLKKNNVIDYLEDNNLYVEYLVRKWKKTPPSRPIIAAGSTGSIKSTSKLIQALATINNGFVILKGIDFEMSDKLWDNIEITHHAFLTKRLLENINVDRKHLKTWHSDKRQIDNWQIFVSNFMIPSKSTIEWQNYSTELTETKATLIECNNTLEEAMLINIKIRELLEKNNQIKIGIITNNNNLVDKIITLSEKWNINIESSKGIPLIHSTQYSFISTILDAISENFAPVFLLALLKHPLFHIPIQNYNDHISNLEIKYLRGICRYDTLDQLIQIVDQEENQGITELLAYVKKVCEILIQNSQNYISNINSVLKKIITVAEQLSENLWNDNHGKTLYKQLYNIAKTSNLIRKIHFHSIQNILKQLLQNKTSTSTTPSNVRILSNIESRLLNFDYTIIAGLNEGDWPTKTPYDPWFTNNMYQLLNLSHPEQTIGQSAYDFFGLMQGNNVLLTRSLTQNGNATTPTRWLIRMETLAHKIGAIDKVKPHNHHLKQLANHLLYHPDITENSDIAVIKPKLSNELNKLSVTQIEKLIRDPYNIYASEILRLKKLDPIDKQPDHKDFGIFIHSILDRFNKVYHTDNNHHDLLITLSDKILNSITKNHTIKHLWKLKFTQMIEWIIKFEHNRRRLPDNKIYTEIKGVFINKNDFKLTMKADRIEVNNNLITIIDFKTGNIPSQQDVIKGFSPQLPLEALITTQGKLEVQHVDTQNKDIALIYIQISPGKNLGKITAINAKTEILPETMEKNITSLINQFNNGAPFLISPRPTKAPKYNNIEHLERIN